MTDAGRHLLFKWHNVVVSGAVECHGYDQAALQMVVLNEHLQRIQRVQRNHENRSTDPLHDASAPLFLGCKQPACGGGDDTGFKVGQSCNARYFHAVQQVLGDAGVENPTGHELDNGLANHHFPLGERTVTIL